MSFLSRSPIPSTGILRYLRSQSEAVYATEFEKQSCASLQHYRSHILLQCRRSSSTSRKHTGNPTSHTDDLWLRNRDGSRALPTPRHFSPPLNSRNVSTKSSPSNESNSIFSRMFRRYRRPHAAPKSPREAYAGGGPHEDSDAQLFNLSRALSRQTSGVDLKLRCTEFDANGSVTLVSGEFKKSELIAKYGLLPRDLRKIDSSVLPHILVRPSAILINLLHLRVLIQSDRVLVFDAYGSTDSYTQSLFMYDLEGKLRQKSDPKNTSTYLPYEFRALEAVLISVTSGLEAEFALVRGPVTNILGELEEDIDREKLRHLLIHSKKLGTFEQKARLVRDAIDDLLEADDDLSAMYLTERKQNGNPREEDDHQEVEMLLESYHKICDEIVEISGNLIGNIRNTEEVVKAILDANRNQLMLLEIKFSIGTLGLAGGTLIAGLYGMNLENFIEESNFAFGGITFVCFGLSAIICVFGMRKLRKVQKVRMWGEQVDPYANMTRQLGGRGNWRSEAFEHQTFRDSFGRLKGSVGGGGGLNTGPVLWPGMDGLGMHKLSSTITTAEPDEKRPTPNEYDTNSDADDTGDGPSLRIKDDLDPTEDMRRDEKAQKALIARIGKGNLGSGSVKKR